jgi:hypothetical protein
MHAEYMLIEVPSKCVVEDLPNPFKDMPDVVRPSAPFDIMPTPDYKHIRALGTEKWALA